MTKFPEKIKKAKFYTTKWRVNFNNINKFLWDKHLDVLETHFFDSTFDDDDCLFGDGLIDDDDNKKRASDFQLEYISKGSNGAVYKIQYTDTKSTRYNVIGGRFVMKLFNQKDVAGDDYNADKTLSKLVASKFEMKSDGKGGKYYTGEKGDQKVKFTIVNALAVGKMTFFHEEDDREKEYSALIFPMIETKS